ncbi:MAG: alpha/beta hydrolase [Propionibacteriales bacterium]|nr:alpha/beta hydrolase [Propionibacteriales bacterium]
MSSPDRLPPPRYVDLDGTRVATYVLEPSDREPRGDVVLCHGTPWSSAVWAPVAHALAATHRALLWDMPSYGASIPEGPPTRDPRVDLEAQRRRLAALLQHWDLTSPHVVAHDVGGAVALGAHLLEASAFASLYLLDVVTLDPWGSPFFRLVAEHEAVFAALPAPLHAALVREYVSGAGRGSLHAQQVDELVAPWTTPHGQRAFYAQVAQLEPAHTRPVVERLGRTRCPVRVGWGEQDPWLPVEQAAELADRLAGPVDVLTVRGAGHLVPLEAPDLLVDDLRRWLDHVG